MSQIFKYVLLLSGVLYAGIQVSYAQSAIANTVQLEARNLLAERDGFTDAASLCVSPPASSESHSTCVSAFLKALANGEHLHPTQSFLNALRNVGLVSASDLQLKLILLELIQGTDEALTLNALYALRSFELDGNDKGLIRNILGKVSTQVRQIGVMTLALQSELAASEIFGLVWPMYKDLKEYPIFVEMLSTLTEASFSHVRFQVYTKDTLVRAAIAEAIGNRRDSVSEEKMHVVHDYSVNLIARLRTLGPKVGVDDVIPIAEEYISIQEGVSFARRSEDPRKALRDLMEAAITQEEFTQVRAAYALFALGSEEAIKKAQLSLPLIAEQLDNAPMAERMMLLERICSLSPIPIDLRRRSLIAIVDAGEIEAAQIVECLSRYEDPELFSVFLSGMNSSDLPVQSVSFKALHVVWSKLNKEQRSVVCKHEDYKEIFKVTMTSDREEYCA